LGRERRGAERHPGLLVPPEKAKERTGGRIPRHDGGSPLASGEERGRTLRGESSTPDGRAVALLALAAKQWHDYGFKRIGLRGNCHAGQRYQDRE